MATIQENVQEGRPEQAGQTSWFGETLKKIPAELRYTLLLFVTTRVVLSAIGYISHNAFGGRDLSGFPRWFDMWNVWDSNWYIEIARNGYSTALNSVNMANYAFFPLYPMAMRLVALATSDYMIAGLIISNVSLLVAGVYIYRLVEMDNDGPTAMRAIKYLFLFPTAFILSGVFTESTFLALSLACFYYARKGNWLCSGALGLMAALTRSVGIVLVLPMAYEYLRSRQFDLRKMTPDALCVLLPALGLSLFSAFNYYLTGDFLAFVHAESAWGGQFSNPAIELGARLLSSSGDVRFEALFTLAALALLIVFVRKIGLSYFFYGLLLILIPLSTPQSSWSMARYALVIFPLYIIFAKLGENPELDQAMTVGLAMLQGLLMALWTIWSFYII